MGVRTDLWTRPHWLPGNHQKRLDMAHVWTRVFEEKAGDWNIPAAAVTAFDALIAICITALARTADITSRSHTDVVACDKAFADLGASMEDLKIRYLLSPPLTAEDRAILELPDADAERTAIGTPQGTMRVGVRHGASNQVSIICDEDPDSKPDKARVRTNHQIAYELADPGVVGLSMDPDSFGRNIADKSPSILVNLPPGSTGKKIRVAGRYLNPTNAPGPWGTIVEAMVT
jgi:hypothetical protein